MGERRRAHLDAEDTIVGICDPRYRGDDRVPAIDRLVDLADAVVVATSHDVLAAAALVAVRAGKRVFIEKPCARSAAELAPVVAAAEAKEVVVRAGYTLRHHPALQRAQAEVVSRRYGPILYMRVTYGHGGDVAEWHLERQKGGGELLDQGVHLIDIVRWFFDGDETIRLQSSSGRLVGDPVEQHVALTLASAWNARAYLFASWNEWRPTFRLDVMCADGGVTVEGLGGAYGEQSLTLFRSHGIDERIQYGDTRERALNAEWASFKNARYVPSQLADAMAVLKIADSARPRTVECDECGSTIMDADPSDRTCEDACVGRSADRKAAARKKERTT